MANWRPTPPAHVISIWTRHMIARSGHCMISILPRKSQVDCLCPLQSRSFLKDRGQCRSRKVGLNFFLGPLARDVWPPPPPISRGNQLAHCMFDFGSQAGGVSCTTIRRYFGSGTMTSSCFFVRNRKSRISSCRTHRFSKTEVGHVFRASSTYLVINVLHELTGLVDKGPD